MNADKALTVDQIICHADKICFMGLQIAGQSSAAIRLAVKILVAWVYGGKIPEWYILWRIK